MHKVIGFASVLGLTAATVVALPSVSGASRNGLWTVVHRLCLGAYQGIGVAFPCTEVNIANGTDRGFAVLRVPLSPTHVIVVPTTRITGIESPVLLSEHAPNYWEAAWNARHFVEEAAQRQLPRNDIGMAINSAPRRSQDQLHIHVACVSPSVADFLRRHGPGIHETWSPLGTPLIGHRFWAMKVEAESLDGVNPFQLLAEGPGKSSMGRHMLAVIGATFQDGRRGFYLLTNDPGTPPASVASAEALLGSKCGN